MSVCPSVCFPPSLPPHQKSNLRLLAMLSFQVLLRVSVEGSGPCSPGVWVSKYYTLHSSCGTYLLSKDSWANWCTSQGSIKAFKKKSASATKACANGGNALLIVSKCNGNFSALTAWISDRWNSCLNTSLGSLGIPVKQDAEKVEKLLELGPLFYCYVSISLYSLVYMILKEALFHHLHESKP